MSALQDAIDELRENRAQWQAFNTEDHCVVLAPPGSGKTKLLTTKLAYTLASGAVKDPQGAACITMTNEAALELRRRLGSLGVRARPNLFVGTVHAFALGRVIRPLAAAAGRVDLAAARLATAAEARIAFDAACDRFASDQEDRANLRATCERTRQRLDYSGDPWLGGPRVAQIAIGMQAELENRGLFDFYDLVRHAVDLVENVPWIRGTLAATFPRLFVDEYQDLAPGLDRIVRALSLDSGADATLFAVGDPDQSIYAFSGAHPQLLRLLAREADVAKIRLETNYRSGQEIIDIALRALGETRTIVGQRPGGTVEIHAVDGAEAAQSNVAAELVRRCLDSGTLPEEVAVLSPWGSDRDRIAGLLRSLGVAVFARSDDLWRSTPLTMLLERLAAWSADGESDPVDLAGLLDEAGSLVRGGFKHDVQRSLVQLMFATDGTSDAFPWLEQVLICMHLLGDLGRASEEDAHEVDRMRDAIRSATSSAPKSVAELGARARAKGCVLAATIHAAKGLEFDDVILVGADNAALYGFSPTSEEVEEARRKFYVAITRARHNVMIVHGNARTSRRNTPYRVEATPFIAELGL